MNKKLKPCPFCGGEAQIGYWHETDPVELEAGIHDGHVSVFCTNCGTSTIHAVFGRNLNNPIMERPFNKVEDAENYSAKIWNTRSVEWRPIKTAPKDGTKVLLLFEDHDVEAGFFARIDGVGILTEQEEGWKYYDYGYMSEPIAWQPLPKPPKEE